MNLVVLATMVTGACLNAATFTYVTPPGSTIGGDPVSAAATFTTGAGSLSITLSNLQGNIKSAGELLSDLFFSISNGSSRIRTGSLASSSGNEIFVNSDGTITPGGAVSTGWKLTAGSTFHIDGLNGATNTPADLIIGPPDTNAVYSNGNNSITGNGPHNPFLNQTATFTLSIPSALATSTISNVVFSFGTTSGNNIAGILATSAVPEPASVGLLLTVLVGSAWLLRKRSGTAV